MDLERLEDRLAPDVRTWTGGGANDLWSNVANWDTGVPVDGDDVRIAATAASAEVLFDSTVAGTGVTINSLTSDGTNPITEPFRIAGDTLTLTGVGPFLFGADLTVAAGTITGTGVVTVTGPMTWNGGILTDSNVGVNVDFNINGGLTMAVTTKVLDGRTLNLNSNATWSGVGLLRMLNSAVLNVAAGATMTVQGNLLLDDGTTNSTETINVFGTWRKASGAQENIIEPRFNVDGTGANEGLVDIQTGTLHLRSLVGGTFAGASFTEATVQGAGTLELNASATDVYSLNAGAALTGTGTVQLTSGILRLNGAATIGTAVFLQTGGRVEGNFNLTVGGFFEWRAGTHFSAPGAAQTILNGGALFSVNDRALDGRTLNLNSGATWAEGNIVLLNNAVLNNNAGSLLDIQRNVALDDATGVLGVGEQFNNFGTVLKSGGLSVTTIQTQFTNSGVVEVRNGTISLTGTFTNYNAATRTLSGGQYRVHGGLAALVPSRLRWNNARISINDAAILLDGPNAEITDQSNVNALADLARNTAGGSLTLDHGANLIVNGAGNFLGSFDGNDPEPNGQLVSIAFDPLSGNVFIYGNADGTIAEFTPSGQFVDAIPVPAASNDIDMDFLSEAVTINGVSVPANSLLVVDGEDDLIYALNKNTGAVIAQVTMTGIGASVQVGGAYHPLRDTIFVVERNGTSPNDMVREINPNTGAQINAFSVTPASSPTFEVIFGDIEVNETTGNLFIVSSNQARVRELTPTGAFVQDFNVAGLALGQMSGIALNDATGETWITSLNAGALSNVFRLNGFAAVLGSFDATREPTGNLAGIALDPATGNPFLYGTGNTRIVEFTPAGAIASSIPVGVSSNAIDLDFAPEALTISGTSVPAGSLLIIDGDSNTLRAVNKTTGALIAQVTLGSAGHEVGGAYHAGRDTLFVVEDNTDLIRELNPNTGAVLNSFPVNPAGLPGFLTSAGDLEVNQTTGNLFIVSSAQDFIREMTPTGAFVRDLDVSGLGVLNMRGTAIDDTTGQMWISTTGTGPNVFRLGEPLFENAGQLAIRNSTFSVAGGNVFRQTGGTTTLDNGGLAIDLAQIQAGVLTGNGFVVGDVTVLGSAQVNAGLSPGQIRFLRDPYLGPTPYLQQSDSPFNPADFMGAGEYFHLENFEDGLLNTPGVTASAGAVIAPPTTTRDSVDADDGAVDGTGQTGGLGTSFSVSPGPASITFTFNAGVLGSLPTHAGLVWTDGNTPVVFEAFDAQGRSLGAFGPQRLFINAAQGATNEDRFFGVRFAGGISAIRIEDRSGAALEIDHLQYGFDTVPVAGTIGGDLTLGTSTVVNVEISNVPAPIGPDANRRVLGPTPYLQASDSPFSGITFASYFHLENFEDNLFNVPGVTANPDVTIVPPTGSTDSVDGDDGTIDGLGRAGRSLRQAFGSLGITFTFNAAALGGLPTHVGIVWTDSDAGTGTTIVFQAYDQNGLLIGSLVGNHADGVTTGTTAEDRFYGAVNPDGISAIHIGHNTGVMEVDHLQFGRTTLTPSAPTRTFDQLDVKGDATLAGVLNLSLLSGFVPTVGQVFAIVPDSLTRSGTFATVNGSQINTAGLFFDTEYRANGVDVIVAQLDAGANATLDEGQTFTLAGTFGDPGADDVFTATINWGDGSPVEAGTVNQVANTVSGSHLYGDNGVFTVTVTITAPDGTRAVDSLVVTINNVAPSVEAGGPYFCPQEGTVQLSGSATDPAGPLDPLTFVWDLDNDGIFGETGAAATRGNETGPTPTFSSAGLAAGTMFTVTLRVSDGDGGVGQDTATIIIPDTLHVNLFTLTATGFIAQFNRAFDAPTLNLYDGFGGTRGETDVTVVGSTTGPVRGSLVIDPSNTRFTFIRTGGLMPSGTGSETYTVTFRSAANAFKTPGAMSTLLDGNIDGTAGDNFVRTFTVTSSPAVVVSIPDFSRGPEQPVHVSAAIAGLPIFVSNPAGITSLTLNLRYNTTLLSINGATTPIAGASTSVNTMTPGVAAITFTSPSPLSGSGLTELVRLDAAVPNNALYNVKHVLNLDNISLMTGAVSVPTLDDDGLHAVVYVGDTNASGGSTAGDATNILRKAVGLPILPPAFIPDPPAAPSIMPGPVDPFLNIPKTFRARPGRLVTVPVKLDYSEGLRSADFALSFDAERLEVVSAQRGRLTRDFDVMAMNLDQEAGTLQVGMVRTAGPVSGRGRGNVLRITFRVKVDAPVGSAIINIRRDLGPTMTQLNDGELDLIPDPSNEAGDVLDGLITVRGPARARHDAKPGAAVAGQAVLADAVFAGLARRRKG